MSCPEGQVCFNNNNIVIVVVMIIGGIYVLYNLNLYNIEKTIKDKNNFYSNQEDMRKNLNIKIDMPEQSYRQMDPDYSNKFVKRVTHPLYPPEKSTGPISSTPMVNRVPGLPINIKTQGYGGDYQQIGILYKDDTRLPLYGRQTYRGSNQWNYYTSTDSNQSIKLPVVNNTTKCTDERGCPEINNSDSVNVSSYDSVDFKAEIYSNDGPRYIPYV